MECDQCGREIDRHEYYENDGYCDECLELEDDWFDHLSMHIVHILHERTLDEKIIPLREDVYDNIVDEGFQTKPSQPETPKPCLPLQDTNRAVV